MNEINEYIGKIKNLGNEAVKIAYDKIQKIYEENIKQEKEAKINEEYQRKGIKCPKCQSLRCVKNGKRKNRQKYLCKECRASFDALRDHFTFRSRLNNYQWEWLFFLMNTGMSSRNIAKGIEVSLLTAWRNRQKIIISKQLMGSQIKFDKLKGRIEIDETFIKEIHKGNFKDKKDPRKQYVQSDAKDLNTCIVTAIDEQKQIYVKATKLKRLQKEFCKEELTNNLIEPKSTLVTDMQTLYQTVAKQTNCELKSFKVSANKIKAHQELNNIAIVQSNLKEFLTHYHGIGFVNIQSYLNLWKWQYQHLKVPKQQQFELLYFSIS